MLKEILYFYVIGVVIYLMFAGYMAEKHKAKVTSHLLLIVATILWPLYVLMGIGTVIARRGTR